MKYFNLFHVREEFYKIRDDTKNLLIKNSLALFFSHCLGFAIIVLKLNCSFDPILFYLILGAISVFVVGAVMNIILCSQQLRQLDLDIQAVNEMMWKE